MKTRSKVLGNIVESFMFNSKPINGPNFNQTVAYSPATNIPISQIPISQQAQPISNATYPDIHTFPDNSSHNSSRSILHQSIGSSNSSAKRKNRQAFSQVEDERLRELVQKYGETNWTIISQKMVNRNPRQCRDRWRCYLRPTLVKSQWTDEEDRLLIKKYNEIGPKWSIIGKSLPGRSEITMKNRWKLLTKLMMIPVNSNMPVQPVMIPPTIQSQPPIPPTPQPPINLNSNAVNNNNIYFVSHYGQQQIQPSTVQLQPIAAPQYFQPSIPIGQFPIQSIKMHDTISQPPNYTNQIPPPSNCTNPIPASMYPQQPPSISDSSYLSSESSASTSASDHMQSTTQKETKYTTFIPSNQPKLLNADNHHSDQPKSIPNKSPKIHILSKPHPIKIQFVSKNQFQTTNDSPFKKKSQDSSPDTSSADGELANNGMGIRMAMDTGISGQPQAASTQNLDAFLHSISNGH